MNKIKTRNKLGSVLVLALILVLISSSIPPSVLGAPIQDDTLGTWTDTFDTENYLKYSEEFDNTSGWSKTNATYVTITANTSNDPNSELTAETITTTTISHGVQQTASGTGDLKNRTFVFSVYVKTDTTADFILQQGGTNSGSLTANNTWQRFDFSKAYASGTSILVKILLSNISTNYYIWGAQLEEATTPTTYNKTTLSQKISFSSNLNVKRDPVNNSFKFANAPSSLSKSIVKTSQADWDAGTKTRVDTVTSPDDVKILQDETGGNAAYQYNGGTATGTNYWDSTNWVPNKAIDNNYASGDRGFLQGTANSSINPSSILSLMVKFNKTRNINKVRFVSAQNWWAAGGHQPLDYLIQYTTDNTAIETDSIDSSKWQAVPNMQNGNPDTSEKAYQDLAGTIPCTLDNNKVIGNKNNFEKTTSFEWISHPFTQVSAIAVRIVTTEQETTTDAHKTYIHEFQAYTPNPIGYYFSAEHISPAIDVGVNDGISAFASFSSTTNIPANTTLTFYSRTSPDNYSWSSYQEITGGNISSLPDRYFQIKVSFTTDQSATPTLSDYTINYNTGGIMYTQIVCKKFTKWNQLSFNVTNTVNTQIKIQIAVIKGYAHPFTYSMPAYSLISDTYLPGNSSGFISSPIDLSNIPREVTYGGILVKAIFTTTNLLETPELNDWTTTWDTTIPPYDNSGLANSPWPAVFHDSQRTSRTSSTGPIYPALKWVFVATGKKFYDTDPQPGRLYYPAVDSSGSIIVGTQYSRSLLKINPSGTEEWNISSPVYYTIPSIDSSDTIYIGSEYGTPGGSIIAINPDGSTKWTGSGFSQYGYWSFPSLLGDGSGIFGFHHNGYDIISNTSLVDGSKIFYSYLLSPSGYSGGGVAEGKDGNILVAIGKSYLYKYNRLGAEIWRRYFNLGTSGLYRWPVVADDGTIYISWTNVLYALNSIDGSTKWSLTLDGVITSPNNGKLISLTSDNKIVVGTDNKKVYLITDNGTFGSINWTYSASSVPESIAVDGNDMIFIGDGNLMYALDINGNLKWKINNSSLLVPTIGNNILYATSYDGTSDGKFYAFQPWTLSFSTNKLTYNPGETIYHYNSNNKYASKRSNCI